MARGHDQHAYGGDVPSGCEAIHALAGDLIGFTAQSPRLARPAAAFTASVRSIAHCQRRDARWI